MGAASLVPHTVHGLGGEHGDWLVASLLKWLQAGRKRWPSHVLRATSCPPHRGQIPLPPPKPGDAELVLLPAGCWRIDCFLIQSDNQETLIAR